MAFCACSSAPRGSRVRMKRSRETSYSASLCRSASGLLAPLPAREQAMADDVRPATRSTAHPTRLARAIDEWTPLALPLEQLAAGSTRVRRGAMLGSFDRSRLQLWSEVRGKGDAVCGAATDKRKICQRLKRR